MLRVEFPALEASREVGLGLLVPWLLVYQLPGRDAPRDTLRMLADVSSWLLSSAVHRLSRASIELSS